MTPEIADAATKEFIKMMRERLEGAVRVAKAAHACAAAGSPEQGLQIVDELGQDLRDADKMLTVALGISRCTKMK